MLSYLVMTPSKSNRGSTRGSTSLTFNFLTGRYPGNAGVRSILGGFRTATGLPPEVPTIAAALHRHGYATAMCGKWHLGLADGMVSGAVHTPAHTVRPALEIVKTAPDAKIVSSVHFVCLPDRVLLYGDCLVVPEPDAARLTGIARLHALTACEAAARPCRFYDGRARP